MSESLGEESAEERAVQFPQANMVAVRSIAGAVASTLGPTPQDKLIVRALATRQEDDPNNPPTDDYTVTHDGATILNALPIEHPIAPVVRRIVGPERPGDTEVEGELISDGITSTVVLASALLDEAEDLLDQGVHPTAIIRGYDEALTVAAETLRDLKRDPGTDDWRDVVEAVAAAAMTGNDIGQVEDEWAAIAVDAVEAIGDPTPDTFAVRSFRTGSVANSRLIRGAILDRSERAHHGMPSRLEDVSVLVIGGHETGSLQHPSIDDDWTIEPDDPDDLDALTDIFDGHREAILSALASAGVDVVVTRLGIDPAFQSALEDHGILGIRGVNRLKLSQVAHATGASIVHHPADVDESMLGTAGIVREELSDPRKDRRKNRRRILFEDCSDPDAVAVLLEGTFGQLADQATTELRKAAAAVAAVDGRGGNTWGYVPGGGAADVEIARRIRSRAPELGSRAQLGARAFADATEMLPFSLAKNAGRDPITTVADLRAHHDEGNAAAGLVLPDGHLADTFEAGIVDPFQTRHDVYTAATEISSLLLRIDDAIDSVAEREPAGPDDAIYDDHAERHRDHIDEESDTIWN